MRLWRFLYLASCCFLTAESGDAQDVFSIAGQVRSETTGAPIARALVRLQGFVSGGAAGQAGMFSPRESFSDVSGAFRFDGLPKGAFTIMVAKPRFVQKFDLRPRTFEVGPSRDQIAVLMTPLSVVKGTVMDAHGRPMQGVQIRAYTSRVTDGRRVFDLLRSVNTDDRGQYRLWGISAGKLYIKAAGRAGGTALFMSDRLPTFASSESFAPVYFGGANRLETATPIDLPAGQEAEADFRLTLLPAHRIRGVVENLQPYGSVKFELLSGGEDVAANRALLNAATGLFEVHDVIPGAYRLRVTQGTKPEILVAEETVQVSEGDIAGLRMRAHGSVELGIRVEISGESEAAPEPQLNTFGGFKARARSGSFCGVRLTNAADAKQFFPSEVGATADELKVLGLPAGEYIVEANCGGAYVSGMRLGSIDVLGTRRIVIAPGVRPPIMTIQGVRNGGRVEVTREGVAAGQDLQALLVPNFPHAEGPRIVYSKRVGVVGNLAPGEYSIYVVRSSQFAYRDPEAVRQLRNGATVRIRDGETAKVIVREVSQ